MAALGTRVLSSRGTVRGASERAHPAAAGTRRGPCSDSAISQVHGAIQNALHLLGSDLNLQRTTGSARHRGRAERESWSLSVRISFRRRSSGRVHVQLGRSGKPESDDPPFQRPCAWLQRGRRRQAEAATRSASGAPELWQQGPPRPIAGSTELLHVLEKLVARQEVDVLHISAHEGDGTRG